MRDVPKLLDLVTKRDALLSEIESTLESYNNFSSPEDGCCHDCAFGDMESFDASINEMQSDVDKLNKQIDAMIRV